MAQELKSASGTAPRRSDSGVAERVRAIIEDVRTRGDAAVAEYADRFDSRPPEKLSRERIDELVASLPQQVVDDIRFVQDQVRNFARVQRESLHDVEVETLPGVFLGHRHVPVGSAGAYVPGGRYPLTASAHMTIVTAKAAGVPHVVACTPPIRGEVPAATVAAMHLAGADEIHILGGVQAVAAMTVGTESVTAVDMLAGPGNAYVAEAKRQLFGEVGIDLFAGPTEILVIADGTADPLTVAVDLLSQAEHGPDSPAVLVTTSEQLGREVLELVDRLLPGLPTNDMAGPAWRDHGRIVVCEDADEMWRVSDELASEHVQVFTAQPREALDRMRNYGALFLGEHTCVSYGDKVIGTNHVLPTLGAARYTGGLWVGKYLKTCTFQEVRDPAAIASHLARAGARVVLAGRRADVLEATADRIGPAARTEVCDVADPAAVDGLAARLAGEEISIVVNNAGIAGPVAPLVEVTPEQWDEVFAVNVRGTFLVCRAFLPAMLERGSGDVINVASVSGKRPLTRRTPYCASKTAVLGLTSTLAFEAGPAGVRVNALSPGPVEGDRMSRNFTLEAARTGTDVDTARDAFVGRAALGRMITEDEVGAAVVAMLAMPGLSGSDIDLSAGMVA
ncbi:histidinol dehydrogenase [Pseudonocardia sp. HH130630-07]|uniref:histidinol dehydrogenase n=1 Tax=Pseudonocardia sp. HH130630-07 TaxID=1690815 RepID=UPI0009F458BC|nr:histidinol dehydrogenase [Pseudonocardia sp. HH130630-07]